MSSSAQIVVRVSMSRALTRAAAERAGHPVSTIGAATVLRDHLLAEVARLTTLGRWLSHLDDAARADTFAQTRRGRSAITC